MELSQVPQKNKEYIYPLPTHIRMGSKKPIFLKYDTNATRFL